MRVIITIIIVLALAAGGWYLFMNQAGAPTTGNGIPPPPTATGEIRHISMSDAGFSPDTLTIKVGDTVVFINDDSRDRWPASDIHPTHLLCPGFDALEPMEPGETYSHTFTKAETCPMHDHLVPRLKGSIMIEP